MKMTLLEMTQNILSSMESDEVDSIFDTVEALQIVEILKETYYQLITNGVIPEHKTIARLTSAGATAKVFMKIPDNVHRIEWIKYNKIISGEVDEAWGDVHYLAPFEFMRRLTQRKSSDTTTVSATDPTSSIALDMIANDAAPLYWTSLDDEYILFDSFDAVVDASGLVSSKTLCGVVAEPTAWSSTDAFIPDMDDNIFPLLLAEAKSLAWLNMKQQANPKIERQARNQKVYLQNDKYRTTAQQEKSTSSTGPDYGRRRR